MSRNDAVVKVGADTKDAERALGSLQKQIKGMNSVLKSVAGAFAGVKLAQFTRNVLAASEALDLAASKTGFAVESLQELRFAAEQVGVSSIQMDTALQRFSRRTGEAADGTGVLKDIFRDLNIEIYNSDGSLRDIESTFTDYIGAIANASSEQEKLRLAVAAFDMEGANLVNLLRDGVNGYEELRTAARAAGAVVGRDVVAANARANQSLTRLEQQFSAISKVAVGALAPSLERISDEFGVFLSDETRIKEFTESVANLGYALEQAAGIVLLMSENIQLIIQSFAAFKIADKIKTFDKFGEEMTQVVEELKIGQQAMEGFTGEAAKTARAQDILAAKTFRTEQTMKALGIAIRGIIGLFSRLIYIFGAVAAAQAILGAIAERLRDAKVAQDALNNSTKNFSELEKESLKRERERLKLRLEGLKADLLAQNYRDPLDVAPLEGSADTKREEAAIAAIEKQIKSLEENEKKLSDIVEGRVEARKKEQAVIEQANKLVDDAVLAYEQQIQDIELAMQLSGQDLFYAQEKLKVQRELEKIGKTMTAWDEANLEFSLEELWALKEKSRIQDEYNAQLEQSKQRYQELVRAADPRVTAEQTRIDNLVALENYYVDTRLMSEESYYEALRAIEEQYRLEKYAAEESLQQRIDQLKQQSLQRELEQQGWNRDQAKDIAQTRVDFEKKSDTERVQFGIQQGAELFNSLGQMNEKAFKAAKAFNIANAIMNTYAAATKALAAYPPPFNFIAAAAAVAAGMAQVASIRSQSYSGRAGGGPVQEGKPYVVGEQGRELFVPQGAGKIVPNAGGDVVNVNFSITAMDTRGFDALLAERKPAIINMVRQAMNDKGNRASV